MTLLLAWIIANVLLGALLLSQVRGLVLMGMIFVGAAVGAVLGVPIVIASWALSCLGLVSAS